MTDVPVRVDPLRVFEVKGDVSPLLCTHVTLAVGNNQQVVAAVTGKCIRVMGWLIQADGAGLTVIDFEDGSGGASLLGPFSFAANTSGIPNFLPITAPGYFGTTSGNGLFCDVGTTGANITVFYITHTP